MTPTELSLRQLRAEGWTVDVCERWVPGGPGMSGRRRDLFGMLDLLALRDGRTMGVQTTSHTNVAARLTKMTDDEHGPALVEMRSAGWLIVIHGWRLSTRDGHACPHNRPRCGCRWSLHRLLDLTTEAPLP